MVTSCVGKFKAPVVKQKSFKLEQIVWKFFQADWKRGPMDYPSLRWREKLSSRFEFWQKKMATQFRSFKTAVSSLDFVYRKLWQTPENHPPPPSQKKKNNNNNKIGQEDNRNQPKRVCFLNFIQKSNILFHHMILSFVILNFISEGCSSLSLPNIFKIIQKYLENF